MCIRDSVKAYGQGLELKNPLILAENIDPSLLEVMDITTGADGRIHVPVAATVPALLMGYKVGPVSYTHLDVYKRQIQTGWM